jgi:hypothetical protein
MFKTYLKETLVYVIDHFNVESKKHFNLSLSLFVILSIGVAVFGFLLLLAGAVVFGYTRNLDLATFLEEAMVNKGLANEWVAIAHSLGVLFFGLYGSFIISTINDPRLDKKNKYTMADFREFISPEEWRAFIILLLILFAIHFITFKPLHSWFHYSTRDYLYDPRDVQGEIVGGLVSWLDSVITLIKTYLPYLFASFFIITVYGRKLNKQTLKEYKWPILTALFLAFCTDTLSDIFINDVDKYLIGFVRALTPMSAMMLIPAVMKTCAYLGLAAYFNWGISASLCLPIKMHAEREEPIDEVHNAELPL